MQCLRGFYRILTLEAPPSNEPRGRNGPPGSPSPPPTVGFLVLSTGEQTKEFARTYKHLFVYPSLWGPEAIELDACMPACIYPNHVLRSAQAHARAQSEIPTKCVICMEDFHDRDIVRSMPCHWSHIFHSLCVASWVSAYDKSCPVCRIDLRRFKYPPPPPPPPHLEQDAPRPRGNHRPKGEENTAATGAGHYCFLDIDSARHKD
ncbi:E3 ubiquitin-protein ligase [Porphyridium purpureum]|uniref:E3 ubiquitin-protein ligase n=1 Tax=Porphyridium purpureum TaxID=35688 RepID=A0A5J4Z6J5_PORPP|nr:E3 ubiquitin-protein ligase [Porphyridium purpureum]|eukprot:POR9256..scf295_1